MSIVLPDFPGLRATPFRFSQGRHGWALDGLCPFSEIQKRLG
jgi:hypothetical protein